VKEATMKGSLKKKLAVGIASSALAVGGLIATPASEAQAWTGTCGYYTYHSAKNEYTCTRTRHVLGYGNNSYAYGAWVARGWVSYAPICAVNEWLWGSQRGY
jgi:hypothetical protein